MYRLTNGAIDIVTLSAWVNQHGEVVLGEGDGGEASFFTLSPLEAKRLAKELNDSANGAQS